MITGPVEKIVRPSRCLYHVARLHTKRAACELALAGWRTRRRDKPSVPHLVLLAWQFPPRITGGVYRPLALVRHAVKRGWKVTVVCEDVNLRRNAPSEYLTSQIPPETNLLMLKPRRPLPLFVRHEWLRTFSEAEAVFRTVVKLLGPDVPSIVVATGPPFFTFLGGAFLSRWFSSPLVLDYRDEWTESPFKFGWVTQMDRHWESQCLRLADKVCFTTQSQLDHYLLAFPDLDGSRCRLIPNGWEPADFDMANVGSTMQQETASNLISISFFGCLGSHNYSESFLECLSTVLTKNPQLAERVQLYFVGQMRMPIAERVMKSPCRDLIRLIAHLPKPEANRWMTLSTILLLPNSQEFNRYLPGKFFDYLASRRPILVYGRGGESGRLVDDLQAGICVEAGDPEALESAIIRLLGWKAPESRIAAWLRDHTRARSSERMLETLRELVSFHVKPTLDSETPRP